MNWFEISVEKLREALSNIPEGEKDSIAMDLKYGNYDYSQDARSAISTTFSKTFTGIVSDLLDDKTQPITEVLVAGANSGYEVPFLGGLNVTALDISFKALQKLRNRFPYVKVVQGNVNKLPFEDATYDLYISMRTLHSKFVDINIALEEALRVLKPEGSLILSVSNGYLLNGQIQKGMYVSKTKQFDTKLPHIWVDKIVTFLKQKNFVCILSEIDSEIIIVARRR